MRSPYWHGLCTAMGAMEIWNGAKPTSVLLYIRLAGKKGEPHKTSSFQRNRDTELPFIGFNTVRHFSKHQGANTEIPKIWSLWAKVILLRESRVTFYTTESTCDAKLGVVTTSSVTFQAIMSNSLSKRAKLFKGSSTSVVPHGNSQRRQNAAADK